jgi:EpsI family protein
MTARIYFAALALLGIFGAAESLKGRGMPTELAHLQFKLDQMPQKFGAWSGEDVPLDPQVFQAIGAEMAINRQYRDGRATVNLHSAVFLKYGVRILHPPELCYRGNGYVVANGDGETIEFGADSKSAHPARLLTMDRDGIRAYCLYWYQIGDATFSNADDQRRIVQSFRGKDTWPPMIKVMLETTANSPEEAQRRLKALAALVYPWTRAYH